MEEKQYDMAKFDSYKAMTSILCFVSAAINNNDKDKINKLQYFFQHYVTYCAFEDKQNVSLKFIETLLEIMVNKESMKRFKEDCGFEWDDYTKYVVMAQILQLPQTKRTKVIEAALQNDNIQTDTNLFVLNCFEQILHNKYRYASNNISLKKNESPTKKELQDISEQFNDSLSGTTLEKLFCVAECKFILQKLSVYLSLIVKSPEYSISQNGISKNNCKKNIKSQEYLQIIGEIFSLHEQQIYSNDMKNMKRGLQYFFVSQIWHILGPQLATKTLQTEVFTKSMGLNQEMFQVKPRDIAIEDEIVFDSDPESDDEESHVHMGLIKTYIPPNQSIQIQSSENGAVVWCYFIDEIKIKSISPSNTANRMDLIIKVTLNDYRQKDDNIPNDDIFKLYLSNDEK
eukprot:178485_1